MAIYMVQCKYEQTKTWFVDAASEEDVRKIYETSDLEIEHDAHLPVHETGYLNSVTKLEGKVSKKIQSQAIKIGLQPLDLGEPAA